MYVADFEAFYAQAEQLFKERPLETRYCVKYRHCDGKLVLKVTDDRTCLKYRTDQQSDLKKLERLNMLFMALMARGENAPLEPVAPGGTTAPSEAQQQVASSSTGGKKSRRKG